MLVMVMFCSPYTKDEEPVTLGPFKEVEINDRCVFADGEQISYCTAEDDVLWLRDGRYYDSVKIFAAPGVVEA